MCLPAQASILLDCWLAGSVPPKLAKLAVESLRNCESSDENGSDMGSYKDSDYVGVSVLGVIKTSLWLFSPGLARTEEPKVPNHK